MNLFSIFSMWFTTTVLFYYFLRESEDRWLSAVLAVTFPVSIPIICLHALWKIYSLFSPTIPKARVVSGGEDELSKLQQR